MTSTKRGADLRRARSWVRQQAVAWPAGRDLGVRACAWLALVLGGGALPAAAHHRATLPPPTPWWNSALAAGVLILLVLEVWMLLRSHRRSAAATEVDRTAGQGVGSLAPVERQRELVWSAAPLGLLLFMGVGYAVSRPSGPAALVRVQASERPAADDCCIHVHAKQYAWRFDYPSEADPQSGTLPAGPVLDTKGRGPSPTRGAAEMHVPLGVVVALTLRSDDVLHSFEVGSWALQRDLIPGRPVFVSFVALQPGRFPLYCATQCGSGASEMEATVVVEPEEAFRSWLHAHRLRPLAAMATVESPQR
jgi:heme/copper-type cytochrome/quinol oxidase subunit 2